MKITNTDILEKAEISRTQFYELMKKRPKLIDYVRKGVVAEQLLTNKVFSDYLKPIKENK